MGITVHNKAEMDAFLKEHGIDDVQAWIDNYYIEIENKSEWSVVNSNLFSRFKDKSVFGAVVRTANYWYLCDYFGGGSFKARNIIQIDGNEQLLNKFEDEIRRKGATFRSAEAFGKSLEEFANRSRQRNNGNVFVQIRKSDNGISLLDKGPLDQRKYSNAKRDNGRGTENQQEITITIKAGNDSTTINPEEVRKLVNSAGEVYGFVHNGEIYLDETKLSPEAPLHEYTHLWDNAVKKINPELWNRGIELMKQTSLWQQIAQDENYGKKWEARKEEWRKQGKTEDEITRLIDDLIASEVHARLVGENGQKMLEDLAKEKGHEGILSKLKAWLLDVWKSLGDAFGKLDKEYLDELTLEDFQNMTIRDFAEMVNPNLKLQQTGGIFVDTTGETAATMTVEDATGKIVLQARISSL